MPKKVRSDCGEPCQALSDRDHRFHLLHLKGLSNTEAEIRCAAAKGKKIKRDSARAQGAKRLASPSVQAAVQHHRAIECKRYMATKQRSIERLAAIAEHASMENFATVERRNVVVDGQEGPVVLEQEDVVLTPWEDLTKDQMRAVGSVKKRPDGSIEFTVRDPAAAERQLAALGGWNAPAEVKHSLDDEVAKLLADLGEES